MIHASGSDALALGSSVVQEAIAWRVKLESSFANSDDYAACKRWRAAHPHHEQVWARLDSFSTRLKTLPPQLAHATLDERVPVRGAMSRRTALKSFAIVFGTGTLALAGREWAPWQPLFSDYRTGIGEQRTLTLADGSRISLNTDTTLDVRFDLRQRIVTLLQGEIFITTAPDAALPTRSFSVRTAAGMIRALGTRFMVRQQSDASLVNLFDGALDIRAGQLPQLIRLEAGQQLRFTSEHSDTIETANIDAAAWTDGVIIAKAMRLADLVTELQRYRPGVLRCAANAAELRISGVFPLTDTDKVIAALHRTLPIAIETHTRYWVTLRHR